MTGLYYPIAGVEITQNYKLQSVGSYFKAQTVLRKVFMKMSQLGWRTYP